MNPSMIEPAKSVPVITPEAPKGDDPTTVDAPRPGGSGGGGRGLGRAMLMVVLGFAGGVGGAAAFDAWGEGGNEMLVTVETGDEGDLVAGVEGRSCLLYTSDAAATDSGDALSPREVYQKLSPSVVHINSRVVKTSTGFFGQQEEQESDGTGSGFLIDDDGHVVTNAHVVEGAEEVLSLIHIS